MMKSEWEKVRLTEFVWFQRGFDLPKNNFIPGNIPVYGSTSILGYHNQSKVNGPGVITGRSGTIGKFQYCTGEFWPHNTSLWVKDFKGNSPKFAFYLLQCLDFKSMNSGGAVPTLNRNLLSSFIVDVPSLKAQRKIASILSAYDDLIENNLKRIKLLEEKARLTYEEWFVRMKYPGHENDVVDSETGLPEGWCKTGLEYLCEKITDGTHDSPKKTETGIYLITGKDLKNGFVDFSNASKINIEDHKAIKKRSGLNYGDILFSNIGTLGNLAYVFESFEYSCKNVLIFKRKQHFNHFLLAYLSNKYTKKKLEQRSSGVAQKFFSLSFVRNFKDIFPPKNLIEKYDEISRVIIKEKIKLMLINNKLISSRNILLPRLMSGMIDLDQIKYNYPKEISV